MDGGSVKLIKSRNPHGGKYGMDESTGAWSDNSSLWEQVDIKERERIGYVDNQDGEFWMSFDDWTKNFAKFCLCLMPTG